MTYGCGGGGGSVADTSFIHQGFHNEGLTSEQAVTKLSK